MGSIGIPIKLLNESQVSIMVFWTIIFVTNIGVGAYCDIGAVVRPDLPRKTDRGRGQHERPIAGRDSDQ